MVVFHAESNQVATLIMWWGGTNETNGLPVIKLDLKGRSSLLVQMSMEHADEMGRALIELAAQLREEKSAPTNL